MNLPYVKEWKGYKLGEAYMTAYVVAIRILLTSHN